MPMMNVRIVWMAVFQRFVFVVMRVRFFAVPWKIMFVLVMFVVDMAVRVREAFMLVQVYVVLGEVQPHAKGH